MSNGFGFENSGSWGGAGIALGVGIIEGRIEAQRHREMVAAIQNGHNTNTYVSELEEEHRDAVLDLLKAQLVNKRKDAQIANLKQLVVNHQNVAAQREDTIAKLRAALSKCDVETASLKAQNNALVKSQAIALARKDEHIKLADQRIKERDRALGVANIQIASLRSHTGHMETRIAAYKSITERLEKMFNNAQRTAKRWNAECDAMRAERDEYFDRLVRLARGEGVTNLAAPANASITDAIDAKEPGA